MTDPKACPECLRRSWLLGLAAPFIERASFDGRVLDHIAWLALGNRDLVASVVPAKVSSLLSHVEAMSEDRLASELSTAGCWAVCLHDDLYPAQLREVRSAPRALIGRGDTALLAGTAWKESVSIVGSRTASGYGREVARTLGGDLAAAGAAVISGLAFGTDACAHRGALETG
jgi:DNA processing protein